LKDDQKDEWFRIHYQQYKLRDEYKTKFKVNCSLSLILFVLNISLSLLVLIGFMKNIQVVDIEAIEKLIYNWNQNYSKQFRNDKSMISKDVQECFQHWIGLEPFEFFQYITPEKIMDNLGLINQGLFETNLS